MNTVVRLEFESAAKEGLRTSFYRVGEARFSGFVFDPADLTRRFTIEIVIDGYTVRVLHANAYVHELAEGGVGDACYGFSASLDNRLVRDALVVTARLANLDTAVGSAIILDQASEAATAPEGSGAVRWLGGLRFSGWIGEDQDPEAVQIMVDGLLIDEVRPNKWAHVGAGDAARAVRGFDLFLPPRFGDGAVHVLSAVNATSGGNLAGTPLTFIAFSNALREIVAQHGRLGEERVRAELLDQLIPASVPFSRYGDWLERFPIVAEPALMRPVAIVMVGSGRMDDTLSSLQHQGEAEWVAAELPAGETPVGFSADLVASFLEGEGAACEYVLFGLAGTVLAPTALRRIDQALSAFAGAEAIYGDVDFSADDGSIWPLALSAFDYERMLEQGYCAHLFAVRPATAARSIAAGASDLYRLFNAMLDDGQTAAANIVHIPGSLGILPAFDRAAASALLAAASRAHLQRKAVKARTTPSSGSSLPAVRIARSIEPQSVSIIIPTRDRRQLLQTCIESIRPAVKRTRAEIIVVDNDSADPDTLDYLGELDNRQARVLRVSGPFNFPRLNNQAVHFADGEILCLLNNDVKAIDANWLEEMLSRISAADVGAVGALLLWPSRVVQHGGVVLGTSFAAEHAFNDRIEGDPGYGDLLRIAHECSAVTAACLLTRKRDYLDAGGMDEIQFPVNFNDVDYCLKLRALGRRIVFTPHAKLMHLESASRGADLAIDRKARFERELRNLRSKWGRVLAADPYYSPVLSRDPIPFSALAWPPGPTQPRVNLSPVAAMVPSGF